MTDALVRSLEADTGVTAVVGAGGKKSTLYALADRLEQSGRRFSMTTGRATVASPESFSRARSAMSRW